ncbi:MAG: iron-containing alcohol dehydrogenase, partial [Deltaproteobacteria bacterium]|nr:iron-containing alcohol dehydrogenase [Deltaproteobacteria bacterium]
MIGTGLGDLAKGFSFSLQTRVEYGMGISKKIADEILRCHGTRVLVVTDPGVSEAGLVSPLAGLLKKRGIPFVIFDRVEENPRAKTVDHVAGIAVEQGVDTIVAVGGGSSLDAAKGVAAVASHGGTISDYEGFGRLPPPVIPLIAIPTTAGTGSEVTNRAVITDGAKKRKITVGKPNLAPSVALVDPELTFTLPPAITASTGIDALTHAIEAYTVLCSNPLSDALALHAIELISGYLGQAVERGHDPEARSAMMLGSLLAGISFGNASVAAVHSMAEVLGGIFDVPHGVANAIFLPYVMGFNLPAAQDRLARIGWTMGAGGTDSSPAPEAARQAVFRVYGLVKELGIPSLRKTGVSWNDLDHLAAV